VIIVKFSFVRLRGSHERALRQTEGFVRSLIKLMGLDLPVPDYSTLSLARSSARI
jgi:hypothetical protein